MRPSLFHSATQVGGLKTLRAMTVLGDVARYLVGLHGSRPIAGVPRHALSCLPRRLSAPARPPAPSAPPRAPPLVAPSTLSAASSWFAMNQPDATVHVSSSVCIIEHFNIDCACVE